MTTTYFRGALVVSAQSSIPELPLFPAQEKNRVRKGDVSRVVDGHPALYLTDDVAIPQRGKYLTVDVVSEDDGASDVCVELCRHLSTIDSQFDGGRQLYKLHRLLYDMEAAGTSKFASAVLNSGQHPTVSLLPSGIPIHLVGIYDAVNTSVRLLWTTDETDIDTLRADDPTRFVFYRYPVVDNRPLFLHTQYIISRWYRWNKLFTGPDSMLRKFNALETFLFKNPSISTLNKQTS